MDVSLIICTFNRAENLRKTLDSLQALKTTGFSLEVIIVDNNSTDDTASVVRKFANELDVPVRYLFEGQQGLSYARNKGLSEADGEIIAFTDDDVTVAPYWLVNIRNAFSNPEIGIVGGPVLPLWPSPPPKWLTPELFGYLALLDRGNEDFVVRDNALWGANLAMRKQLVQTYGMFDPSLGRSAGNLYAGEETALIEKMLAGGETAYYCAQAKVFHRIPPARMKKAYFRKWRMDNGALMASCGSVPGNRRLFGIPLYIYRFFLTSVLNAIRAKIFDYTNSFSKEIEVYYYFGIIKILIFGGNKSRSIRS